MIEYQKINTIYKRDPSGKQVLWGQFSQPEFEYLRDSEWTWTEKVDGTNIRVEWDGSKVNYSGRTDSSQVPSTLIAVLREKFDAAPWVETFGVDASVVLFGEGYGAKIQKGGGNYKSDGQAFVLFDVLIGKWWLERADVEDVARNLGLDVVPIIGAGTIHAMVAQVARGFESRWGSFRAEGIVARPKVTLLDRAGKRIITKLKAVDFAGSKP